MSRRPNIAAATLCVTMLMCSSAEAAYSPVADGSTVISFAKPFRRTLEGSGVRIQVRGARYRGGRVTLVASGGEVDPKAGAGTVESKATVVFASGTRKALLRDIVFKAKRAPLYAKVGGGQLKLATGARLTSARAGFGAKFAAAGLRLGAKVASRLNKKLGLGHALSAGQLLGTVRVEVQPVTVHLRPQGRMYLAVDPAFASKLSGLFVSVNPVAPAELSSGPTLSFPVEAESTLAPDASSGTVKLGGQVELLQLGKAQMFWRELWLQPASGALLLETDVEPAPPHPGPAPQAPLLSLAAGGAVGSDPKARTISLQSRPVVLTSGMATLLNEAFVGGNRTFAEGESVGTVSLAADAE
jgi:hypothetical protein